jgi:hypothetical protein
MPLVPGDCLVAEGDWKHHQLYIFAPDMSDVSETGIPPKILPFSTLSKQGKD